MNKVELLSPAGNKEAFISAINAGCDAVYIGGKRFGARAFSTNFSEDEIVELINYAHIRGVKVYITVNTLVYESEVDKFIEYIRFIHKNNVDAVIMQDLGMISLVHSKFPNLEIHGSTQMNIHNVEGAKVLEKIGIKRVVLARETSIDQIKRIKEETNLELEVFVNGAICISYSGQCLMSSLEKNRSGNRGCCAQTCRLKYDVIADGKVIKDIYPLSAKDLFTLDNINELKELGVSSFKIEGRMKSSAYVYQVTSMYYKKLNNMDISIDDIVDLKKIFNREFTKGFLFNESDIINDYRPNNMGVEIGEVIEQNKNRVKIKLSDSLNRLDGIRIIGSNDYGFIVHKIFKNKINIEESFKGDVIEILNDNKFRVGDKVVKTSDVKLLDKISKQDDKKIAIDVKLTCLKNKKVLLEVDEYNIKLESDSIIESSIKSETTELSIKEKINKLGNSSYVINNLEIKKDDNIFIRLKELNDLRRHMVEEINKKRLYEIDFIEKDYSLDPNEYIEEKGYSYYISDIKNYNKLKDYKYLYLDDLYNEIDDDKKILKLPRVTDKYSKYDSELLVGELGGLLFNNINTDNSFNVTNSYTVAFLHSMGVKRVTLSYELSDNQMKDIIDSYIKRYNKSPNLELIISSYPELMILKSDLYKKYGAENTLYLRSKTSKYKVIKKNDCNIVISDKKKEYSDSSKYFGMGINTLRKDL